MSETPILDLQCEPPGPSRSWLSKLIGFVIGLATFLILILGDQGELLPWHWPALNTLLLIPALYVAVGIHELGHLVAGGLAGFDNGGFAVGGFVFIKSGENWTFRFDPRRWIGGFFKPLTNIDAFLPAPFAWMIAGGPLASLTLTVLCLLLWMHSGNGTWSWLGSLFWVALFSLVISVVPFSSGLNRSDGARLGFLLRYPERTRCWIAIMALQSQEARGLRPREWDRDVYERALRIDASAGEYPYCQLMAFYRNLDEGGESAALGHLENTLAQSASSGRQFRHYVFLEAASASALLRKRAEQARVWRERACRLRKPESLNVVEAGIAMCEGRYGEALQHWKSARARVDRRKLDSGLIRFAKEKWAGYESICRDAMNEQSVAAE